MVVLNLSKNDCDAVADFIECYFFQSIREDENYDNIDYAYSLLKAMHELRRVEND